MTLRELKANASALIGKSDFEGVLELLSRRLNPDCDLFQDLILLKSRHDRIMKDDHNGVVSRENANLEYNKIAKALLRLVQQLEENDLGGGGSLEDPLEQAARQLRVDVPLTPLYLVNCDRRNPARSFWKAFNGNLEHRRRFQFYFLPCCPSQQPEGFAERMVHELLEKELDSEYNAINFRRRPGGEERLLIEPLPKGARDAEGSKRAFKKYFTERFGLANSDSAFEDYLNTGLPNLPWQYVVTAFKITDEEWDDSILQPYLQWLMTTFSSTGPDIPNFLFFFIVTVKHAHRGERLSEAAQEALEGVGALVTARWQDRGEEGPAPEDATLIEPLPPVPDNDLETWMEKLGDVPTDQKQGVIQLLASRLTGDEASVYQTRKEFNMERIEDFQEKVYHAHKHK